MDRKATSKPADSTANHGFEATALRGRSNHALDFAKDARLFDGETELSLVA